MTSTLRAEDGWLLNCLIGRKNSADSMREMQKKGRRGQTSHKCGPCSTIPSSVFRAAEEKKECNLGAEKLAPKEELAEGGRHILSCREPNLKLLCRHHW